MLFNSTKRKNNLKRIWYKKNYIKKRNFQKFIKFKNKKYSRIYWWKPTLRKVQHSLKKVLNILKKQKVFKIKLKHLRYKKKKRKRRLKFHQWKKKRKRQRRFINFVKLKKVKRRKRFSEILGFNQRNFMKSFFKIRLIPVFSNLQVEKLVETDKKVQKDEMLDFIRKINKNLNKKKKRKFVLNVRRKIRRKKSRKFKKKSLRLKKKIRKLKKNNKKIIIFSKTSRYVRRLRFKRKYARLLKIKFNRKRKFILFLKLKKRRRRFTKKSSKRFFLRRRKVYRRRFGQMGIKKKKKNKKFTYKRKWNKIVTVRKEFMYLWKDKKRKGNKNFNLIFFKKIIKVHKKFKQRRTKSWRRRRLLLKIRNAGIGLLMKLFYRFTIKKKIKLRLKNKLRKKIKLRNLKKKIKINIKKLKKRFSSFKKKKKKYFYANRRKTKWKARKVFKLLKSSVILKKKKIKQKSIKRNDLMKAKNKFELRLLLYFFRQRKRKIKKRRYNLLYKFKFHKRKKKERKFYLVKFPKKFRLIRFLKYANVKSINQVEFFRWKKNLIIKDRISYSRKFFVIKFKKSLKKRKLKKKKTRKIIRNFVFHKYKILFRKLRFSWNFLLKRKLKYSELLTKKIFLKKEKILFKAKYDHQRKKRKRESWAKTKQRLRYERKIKYRRKRKYLVKLKSKKLLKIKNKVLEKDPTLNKKFSMKRLKRVFYKKAKVYFQKKKKHLKNSIFIRRKKKKRKLIFYIFKTKKWNIQLNNKTSRTFRNKRRTKKYGRQVKKNRIFYYVQNINNGKIRRRRRNVFRLREALKKFIRKITRGLPNNFKNYFSNPNKKEKNKSLEHFSNNFINNINIIIYRVGIFPSLSLSIEAVKQNWICRNFETPNIRENIMNIGDNITLAPSFNVFSNYLWTKRVFIEQMYTMDCSKQEFLFSKKPFLFIFVKIKQKNLITNNAPKDWIKLSLLKNLKLIP